MVDTGHRTNLWEALAGRAPARPSGPDDPDLWRAVVERLDPAKARPRLRDGIEKARLTTVRGHDYVMLRSPDEVGAGYVRLTPEELELANLMDGERTVAALVGDFVRISGRLAPDQVTRVVAELAANRMLTELPVDAFQGLGRARRRPGSRFSRKLLDLARGRRVVLADFDRPSEIVYRWGGRFVFTRSFAVVAGLLIVAGLALFGWTWIGGGERLFLAGGSYATGGLVLLGLNVVALTAHELGHALAVKHAGRRVPAVGFLFYFGIPSLFVDTTDVWMAGRRARMLTTAAGPLSALTLAGAIQLTAVIWPGLAPLAFKLAFAWYLNALFNLNPLMALDGYYLAMDWLEIPNLRTRGMAFVIGAVRRRRPVWSSLDREGQMVAMYGIAAALWTVGFAALSVRLWRDRIGGLVAGLWNAGSVPRILLVAFVVGLFAPLVHAAVRSLARRTRRAIDSRRERDRQRDLPTRLDALRSSQLGALPDEVLERLAEQATWWYPQAGTEVLRAGSRVDPMLVVVDGALEGRVPGDPPGTARRRAVSGGLVGLREVLAGAATPLAWHAAGTRLLRLPARPTAQQLAGVVRPPGPIREEAEDVLDSTPALRHLSDEPREQLLNGMRVAEVAPGRQVELSDATRPVVVSAGVVVAGDGTQHGRGQLLAPDHPDEPMRLTAKSQARLWSLPAVQLVGLGAAGPASRPAPPLEGAHGGDGYVPVAAPPGPPPATDDATDDRLLNRFRLLLILLLLLAILASFAALPAGTGWAEVPDGYAILDILHTEEDPVVIRTASGEIGSAREGARLTLGVGGGIDVPIDGTARLTFVGGGYALVCGGSELTLTGASRPPEGRTGVLQRHLPMGSIDLERGRVQVDTTTTTPSFLPLRLRTDASGASIENRGVARFSADRGGARVAAGEVFVDGAPVGTTEVARCAGDTALEPGTISSPSPSPTVEVASPSPTVSVGPRPSPPPSPTPSAEPTPTTTLEEPAPTATEPPPDPSPSASPSPSPTPSPSPHPSPSPTPSPSPSPTQTASFRVACQDATATAGGPGRTSCTVTADSQYSGTITYTCQTSSSLRCSFVPNSTTLSPNQSETVDVSIDATSTNPGTYSLTIVGTDGSQRASDTITVTVS